MDKGRKPVPVTYNGITYESVYDCAAAFDLSANAVRWRLKHSLPLEPALNFRRTVTYDGRAWSLRELAEHCGVNPRTIARRLRKGGDPAFSGRCGKACEYGGKYYRSHVAMYKDLRLPYGKGEVLREEHEMSVCRTKVADYYHLDGLEDPRLEGELVKDFIAEAKGQIKYRFSVRDVFGDRLERMAVLYAKDKAPKLTVQDDIYDLHLDMARVYLPDIENAEVESYNHAD